MTTKKEYKVEGMMCQHCRLHVENALNTIQGVSAAVTLNPPVASIEFSDAPIPLHELQKAVSQAGSYRLVEN